MTMPAEKTLILCGGLQSSGTTLVSCCFLQRGDTDGVLDAPTDLLPAIDPGLARPIAWYKAKISCFRLVETADFYRDFGWKVRPLLVVRDLRAVWASLRKKEYGCNGITAEDPPLRLRFRRFIDDWQVFVSRGLPILRYEDFIATPETALRQTCDQLGLPWDEAMLTWPKSPSQFADREYGNDSFWKTRGNGLEETIDRYRQRAKVPRLPAGDLEWLETQFRGFNDANGYPPQLVGACDPDADDVSIMPSFAATRRYKWETGRKPIRWLLAQLGWPYNKLIEQRSWKRAA